MALLRTPMAIFKLGRGQLAEGVRAEWGWSSHVALHTGLALGAAAGGDALAGVDAGVSLVQGASRGLGLEFVSASRLPLFFKKIKKIYNI
jgi:hypothetical protein